MRDQLPYALLCFFLWICCMCVCKRTHADRCEALCNACFGVSGALWSVIIWSVIWSVIKATNKSNYACLWCFSEFFVFMCFDVVICKTRCSECHKKAALGKMLHILRQRIDVLNLCMSAWTHSQIYVPTYWYLKTMSICAWTHVHQHIDILKLCLYVREHTYTHIRTNIRQYVYMICPITCMISPIFVQVSMDHQ